jgi:hypothetical protein
MLMLVQNAVEVKFIENQRRADAHACEQRAEMFFKCAALDTEVMRSLLAVVTALVHDQFPEEAKR